MIPLQLTELKSKETSMDGVIAHKTWETRHQNKMVHLSGARWRVLGSKQLHLSKSTVRSHVISAQTCHFLMHCTP